MRALLATCLAFYSVGASATKDHGGGRHESWAFGKPCKQLKKAALACLDNVNGADPEYYIDQLHYVRKELRSCVKVQLDKATAAKQPCSVRSFIYCLTQALHGKVVARISLTITLDEEEVWHATHCLVKAKSEETGRIKISSCSDVTQSKKKKAGVEPFARKIKDCMRQKLKPVHARAFFVPMTTVLAGQAGTEDHTEMPFEMPLMMTTSGRAWL